MATAAIQPTPTSLHVPVIYRVPAALILLGFLVLGWAFWAMNEAGATTRWHAAPGYAGGIEARAIPFRKGVYDIQVRYSYRRPDGLVENSNRVTRFGAVRVHSEAEKRAMETRYAAGAAVTAQINPQDPRMSVLVPGATAIAPLTGPALRWGGILLIVGLLLLTVELNRAGRLS